jgi:excisionase family DNA binding protein
MTMERGGRRRGREPEMPATRRAARSEPGACGVDEENRGGSAGGRRRPSSSPGPYPNRWSLCQQLPAGPTCEPPGWNEKEAVGLARLANRPHIPLPTMQALERRSAGPLSSGRGSRCRAAPTEKAMSLDWGRALATPPKIASRPIARPADLPRSFPIPSVWKPGSIGSTERRWAAQHRQVLRHTQGCTARRTPPRRARRPPRLADLGVLYGGRGRLLRVAEVAYQLGVSTATVYNLCAAGELPHVRIVDSIRVRPRDLATFLEGRLIEEAPLLQREPGRRR